MPYTTRELLARLIQCEAGGEGDTGMKAVASVIINRSNISYGEFSAVSLGGDVRRIIEQPGQFTCMKEAVSGIYNSQNIYNMNPEEIHYEIADWALSGNTSSAAGDSLFFLNPYRPDCPPYFPFDRTGVIFNRINKHCFYSPTAKYATTTPI